jgi:hypothetical protein
MSFAQMSRGERRMVEPESSARVCRHARGRVSRLLLAGAVTAGLSILAVPAQGRNVRARAARTFLLSETGHLHLTSHHGFTLNEEGSATGTVRGRIFIHLTISSTNHVSAQVNIYPNGGSISATATAGYRVAGPVASFAGSMSIARGTGSYRHARGAGLNFTGTIQRSNDAVAVHLRGQITA